MVFFKCAPTAIEGPFDDFECIGKGAYPLALRNTCSLPATILTTESSTWRIIGRLCTRKRSEIFCRRDKASYSSIQIGSSLELPLVATMGQLSSCMSK